MTYYNQLKEKHIDAVKNNISKIRKNNTKAEESVAVKFK